MGEFLKKFKWFQKLKNVKHIEIILVVVLACLVLLIWFSDFGGSKKSTSVEKVSSINSTERYAELLESRLESALSKISGAGNVKVMITFDGVTELVLASTKDEKINSTSNSSQNGTTNKTENKTVSTEPVLITENGSTNPIVLMEILPDIKGVIVVAQGADNIRVKLDLLKAVQALLSVQSSQVEIFTGN